MKSLSVITSVLNARDLISRLAESLMQQTDSNFTWIVIDGGSMDGTIEYLNTLTNTPFTFKLLVTKDFGIYDALNQGIAICQSDYYIVAGSDDQLDIECIENYHKCMIKCTAPLITSNVLRSKRGLTTISKMPPWIAGHKSYVAEHALAVAIKTDLHQQYGYYSKRYSIAADQLFILLVARVLKPYHCDFISGIYDDTHGTSSVNYFQTLFEFTSVQIHSGFNPFLQLILLSIRMFRFSFQRSINVIR